MSSKAHCDICDSTEKVRQMFEFPVRMGSMRVRLRVELWDSSNRTLDVCGRDVKEALHLAGIIAAGDFDNIKRAGTRAATRETRGENTPQTDQAANGTE